MIINFKNSPFILVKFLFYRLKYLLSPFFINKKVKKLVEDSEYLDKYFLHKYPALKVDISGQITCVSCKLCEQVCPANAIEIEKSGLLNLPQTLISGEVPSRFLVKKSHCIKCNLCADVCVVNAIELNDSYDQIKTDTIDLISLAEKKVSTKIDQDDLEDKD